MGEYNLLDEAWLPARRMDGTRNEVGIRGALLEAGAIRALEHDSPLVTAGLHRLLLAVLQRAAPTRPSEVGQMIRTGFPPEALEAYFTRWRDRFWLFDDRYPFWQTPDWTPKKYSAWTALAAERNADNAKMLFDHTPTVNPPVTTNADVARALVAIQTFVPSSGKSELAHTSDAPSASSVMVLPVGRSLLETLGFSLIHQHDDVRENDLPVWEREPQTADDLKNGIERAPDGYADLYTWRTRAVRLIPEAGGVTRVAFAQGVKPVMDRAVFRDPMVPHKLSEEKGILPLQWRERGLWRDFDSLLPNRENRECPPQTVLAAYETADSSGVAMPMGLVAYGLSNKQAKINFWRHESFRLPATALNPDCDVHAIIRRWLDDADGGRTSLWYAGKELAVNVIRRTGGTPDKKDVADFIKTLPCEALYWTEMERAFHRQLAELDTPEPDYAALGARWKQAIVDAMRAAWHGQAQTLAGDNAWGWRAFTIASRSVDQALAQRRKELADAQKEENAHA